MASTLKRHQNRRLREAARNQRIVEMYRQLYKIERKRPDDCLQLVADEFCLAPSTVYSLLKKHGEKAPTAPKEPKADSDDTPHDLDE